MTISVNGPLCQGVGACQVCTTQGGTWFRRGDDGKAECYHQPNETDGLVMTQIINACPTGAISATVESGGGSGGTGQLPPPNQDE